MSVIRTVRASINCDKLGCRCFYQGSRGCDYAFEVRPEARDAGWRVNVPRWMGPRNLNPQPFKGARLDFCPEHEGIVHAQVGALAALSTSGEVKPTAGG